MKKVIAGLLAGLLCLAGLTEKAGAQLGPNFPGYFVALAIGTPGYVLNSNGTNYGEVFNSSGANASTTWNLGYGTSSSTLPNGYPAFNANGTAVFSWNTSGQVAVNPASFTLSVNSLLQVNSLPDASSNSYYYLAYRSTGWLELANKGGVLPTISSCGTSPSIASGGDEAGDVTVGTSPSNACSITFTSKPSNIPHCFANDTTQGASLGVKTVSTSGFTVQGVGSSPIAATDRIDWWCFGHG